MPRTTKTEKPDTTERVEYLLFMIEENTRLHDLTGDDQHEEWAKEQAAELKTLKDGE
jgi:hypothetical protein